MLHRAAAAAAVTDDVDVDRGGRAEVIVEREVAPAGADVRARVHVHPPV